VKKDLEEEDKHNRDKREEYVQSIEVSMLKTEEVL
jgi:hypothetical protein